MRASFGRGVLVVVALNWGCMAATPRGAAPESQPAKQDDRPPSIDPKPAPGGGLDARVDGDVVSVSGKPFAGKELAAELGKQRAGAKALSLRVVPEATDQAFADALDAAAEAGFEHVAIDHGGEQLAVEVTNGAGQVRIIAWRSNDRLVAFDLKPVEGTSGLLGSFDLTNEASVPMLRERVLAACHQQPCLAELDLLPEVRPTLWHTLNTWHRAVAGIPALSYRVLAIVPRPSGPAAPGSTPPKVRLGATTVSGRLPPAVIQQIVRSSFGMFRVCYEAGLGRNANLEGRVSARFVIGRDGKVSNVADGKVSNVADGGSDIPDSEVVSCTLKAFTALEFPPPANGIVTVVYPILFAPG